MSSQILWWISLSELNWCSKCLEALLHYSSFWTDDNSANKSEPWHNHTFARNILIKYKCHQWKKLWLQHLVQKETKNKCARHAFSINGWKDVYKRCEYVFRFCNYQGSRRCLRRKKKRNKSMSIFLKTNEKHYNQTFWLIATWRALPHKHFCLFSKSFPTKKRVECYSSVLTSKRDLYLVLLRAKRGCHALNKLEQTRYCGVICSACSTEGLVGLIFK